MCSKYKNFFLFLSALLLLFSNIGAANSFNPQCSQRYIAQNIKSAVLALKATKYCKNIKLPYSRAQAGKKIEELRCNTQASNLLDELIINYDREYKNIMSGPGAELICSNAASLGKDIS